MRFNTNYKVLDKTVKVTLEGNVMTLFVDHIRQFQTSSKSIMVDEVTLTVKNIVKAAIL